MVSLDGSAYSSLENAFRYRSVLDAGCSCGTPALSPVGEPLDEAATGMSVAYPPQPRPEPGEDPETLLDRAGGLTIEDWSPRVATAQSPPDQAVRVVLPAWNETPTEVMLSAVPN
jgi:hypothetical protein